MEFNPKSEDDLKVSLLKEGEYNFDVLSASDTVSKAMNPMIKICLGIYADGDTISARVYDFLLSAMEAKLRHFCDTTGLLSVYESGSLQASDCIGRSGKVRIVVERKDGYSPRNTVRDYVCRRAKPVGKGSDMSVTEEDVPF